MNDSDGVTRFQIDWKAVAVLLSAAALVSSAIYFVGSVFHSHIMADVSERIAAHAESATTKRADLFKGIESDARGAIGRISDMERQCAIMQDWKQRADARFDGLERWRDNCGGKVSRIESQIERDLVDMIKIDTRLEKIEDLVSRGQRK